MQLLCQSRLTVTGSQQNELICFLGAKRILISTMCLVFSMWFKLNSFNGRHLTLAQASQLRLWNVLIALMWVACGNALSLSWTDTCIYPTINPDMFHLNVLISVGLSSLCVSSYSNYLLFFYHSWAHCVCLVFK